MKIGIDWGGTKIEAIALDPGSFEEINRIRVDAPKDNYQEILNTVSSLIKRISANSTEYSVGIGMPGSLHPQTGLVQVSNTKALEGKNVKNDLEKILGFEIKMENDETYLIGVATDYAEDYPDAPNVWFQNQKGEIEIMGTTNINKYSLNFELSK